MFKIKRAYQDPEDEDGYRILVDRLWPRGVSKEKAKFDLWMKEIAPSNELRKWFGHEPEKWGEFKNKYIDELAEKKELINQLCDMEKINKIVTMIYSAKDEKHNNAVVLLELLEKSSKTS
ncbi:DUF488 domain-containing protein [Methanobacterium sp. SMA-27]|uniref:DUF488 domain-containing protein n=1 Tax=Methanobacterium sp. SMA-27 TaxID=1495336 RepID=UPI00064EE523|nr:DUF488 domain-containing protein [Methanobacterium sp. SMA-27]